MNSLAFDPGFPGAGRVVRALAAISDKVKLVESTVDQKAVDSAKYLFLPAWRKEYELIKHPKKVVVWTSPIIQSEHTPEEFHFMRRILELLDKGKLHALWLGSGDWLPVLGDRNTFHCPYPVTLPERYKTFKPMYPPKDVSLFGPLSSRKNIATQAFAAAKAGCTLHTTDEGANAELESLGLSVPFFCHGWQIPARYHDLVTAVDVGLQCSIPGAESFSYVAWDHVSRGTPCLSTVPWIQNISGSYFVREPFDIEHLADRIRVAADVLTNDEIRTYAETFAKERNEVVKATLSEQLGLDL